MHGRESIRGTSYGQAVSGTRPSPSIARLILGVLAGVCLMLGIMAASIWVILAEEGVAPPPTAAVEEAGRLVRSGGAEAEQVTEVLAGDQLLVEVIDEKGTPVPGIDLVLNDGKAGPERAVRSEVDGMFHLEDLPTGIWWEVDAETPWIVVGPSVLRPTVEPVVQTLVVERTCGGAVRVEESDGAPFEGRIRDPANGWRTLDADGRAELPNRSCGRGRIRLSEPRGTPGRASMSVAADVTGDEEILLIAPPVASAIVQVLDAAGMRVEAALHPGEPIGPGRYRLRGRQDRKRVTVNLPGQQTSTADVPLDGGVHEVTAWLDRTVDLTLLCDACPSGVTCLGANTMDAMTTCVGEPPDLTCTCPGQDAVVHARTSSALDEGLTGAQPLGRVPAGELAWTIDARGDRASIEAMWTGNVPCHVMVERDGLRHVGAGDCAMDGSVLISDLFPGEWTVRVSGSAGRMFRRTVVVESGQAVVLGDIGPSANPAEDQDLGG